MDWIKQELRARRLSQRALGHYVGWDDSTVSKVMAQSRQITGPEMIRVMEFFGFPTPVVSDGGENAVQEIARLASSLDDEQLLALLAYLRALPKSR